MTGRVIPQDNRIVHKNMEQSKQAKYCFNLPKHAKILCFYKLTGEHNAKQILKKNFVLWEYIFKVSGLNNVTVNHRPLRVFIRILCILNYLTKKKQSVLFDNIVSHNSAVMFKFNTQD